MSAPKLTALPDVWAHKDGSAHSADGPLGCFPCANERRNAPKLTAAQVRALRGLPFETDAPLSAPAQYRWLELHNADLLQVVQGRVAFYRYEATDAGRAALAAHEQTQDLCPIDGARPHAANRHLHRGGIWTCTGRCADRFIAAAEGSAGK